MRFLFLMLAASLAMPAGAASMREALHGAWSRDASARGLEARAGEFTARRDALAAPFPEPPAVSLGHRGDRFTGNDGNREWEAELELPLWQPGERGVRGGALDAEDQARLAALAARRLAVAGQVREAVWAAASAESALAQAEARAAAAQALEGDVARRVDAGDLARTDLNLARSETLEARAAAVEARTRLAAARNAWRALTGTEALPDDRGESPAQAQPDEHPQLLQARAAIAAAQARVQVAREVQRDAPALAVGSRYERSAAGEPWDTTLAVRIRLPFATEARNRPALAAAQAELTQATLELERERLLLETEAANARREYEGAAEALALAAARAQITEENVRLVQKAFDLGEADLPTLLRVRAAAHQARLAHELEKIAVARAIARLNQALGVLP